MRAKDKNWEVRSFKDLDLWKLGHSLVIMTYVETKSFPKDEVFGLVSQMRRAAVSITSNIAEGFSRKGLKEKIQFYTIAKGSITELQNQIQISRDIGYLLINKADEIDAITIRVLQMINRLILSLHRKAVPSDTEPRIPNPESRS